VNTIRQCKLASLLVGGEAKSVQKNGTVTKLVGSDSCKRSLNKTKKALGKEAMAGTKESAALQLRTVDLPANKGRPTFRPSELDR
jgi:hypothetical protein